MVVRGDELLRAADIVCKERNFQVAMKHSLAGGALAGLTTFAGGVLLGPVGFIVGGLTGGVLGYCASKDKFKPLHEILANDLTPYQRQQLINHLNSALKDVDISDITMLASLVISNGNLQSIVANTVLSYAQEELKLHLQ